MSASPGALGALGVNLLDHAPRPCQEHDHLGDRAGALNPHRGRILLGTPAAPFAPAR